MKSLSRRDLIRMSGAGAVLGLAGWQSPLNSAPARLGVERILVGQEGDFRHLPDAVSHVNDNLGGTAPVIIELLPGVHEGGFSLTRPWVTLQGAGPMASIIQTEANGIVLRNHHQSLRDFAVCGVTTQSDQGLISRQGGWTTQVAFRNLSVEVLGPGAGFRLHQGNRMSMYLDSVRIVAEGVGFEGNGFVRARDLNISLHGDATGWEHVGVKFLGGRFWCSEGWVGTGYQFDYNGSSLSGYKVFGADDPVIGFWVPQGAAANTRLHLYGVESFIRNEDVLSTEVPVNCVRMDGGNSWARLFGCFMQAESPMRWGMATTISNTHGDKVEHYGSRLSTIDGPTFGGAGLGVSVYTTQDDQHSLDKWETGIHRCDSSQGPFSLILPARTQRHLGVGEEHLFVKVDDSPHAVTLLLNGGSYRGSNEIPPLVQQWDRKRLIWDGFEWLDG